MNPKVSVLLPIYNGEPYLRRTLDSLLRQTFADFEVIAVDRLTAIIAEVDPILPGRNERQYAARLAYHQRDFEEQLQLIELCRSHVFRLLNTLSDDCWSRQGMHTEAGPLTLTQQLERAVKHLEHHLPFIQLKRQALDSQSPQPRNSQ